MLCRSGTGASSSSRVPTQPTPMAAVSHAKGKPRRRTNDEDDLTHPLLGDQPTLQLIQPRDGCAPWLPVLWACQLRLLSCCCGSQSLPAVLPHPC